MEDDNYFSKDIVFKSEKEAQKRKKRDELWSAFFDKLNNDPDHLAILQKWDNPDPSFLRLIVRTPFEEYADFLFSVLTSIHDDSAVTSKCYESVYEYDIDTDYKHGLISCIEEQIELGKALYVIKDAIAKKQDIVIGGRFSSKITNKDVVKELELLIRRKFFSHYAEGIAPCIYEDQDEDEGRIKNDSQDGEASTDNTEEDISLEELNEEIEFLKDECDELSQELNKTPRKNERLQIAMLAFEVCGNPN